MNNTFTKISDQKTAIQRMNYLRGIFAILIVLGHCSMEYEKEVFPLLIIHKFNMVSVCFFFIISGISLTYNFHHKKNYLDGFLKNKAVKIFLFAIICELVGRTLRCLFVGYDLAIGMSILFSFNWYVYEIIVFYIVFYFLYKFLKDKNIRIIGLWIISILVSLFTLYMFNNYGSFWTHAFYYSSLCFVWGVMLYEYYEKYIKLIAKYKISCSMILLIIGCISCICLKMPKGSFWGGIVLHNLIGICIMTIVFIWSHYMDFRKISIIGRFTKYATEIYLYQFVCISIIKNLFIENELEINIFFVITAVITTIGVAVVMHNVNNWVTKGLEKL